MIQILKKYFKQPERRKILVYTFVINIFVFIFVIIHSYFSKIEIIKHQISENEIKVEASEHIFNSIFLKIDLALLDVVLDLNSQNNVDISDIKRNHNLLKRRFDLIPEMNYIRIYNSDGQCLGSHDGLLSGENVAQQEYFKKAQSIKKDILYFSDSIKDPSLKKWTIRFGRPILNKNKDFLGFVEASIDLDQLNNQMIFLNKSNESMAALIHAEDGDLLSRFPQIEERIGKKHPLPEELLTKILNGTKAASQQFVSEVDHVERLFSFRHMDGYDVVLLFGTSYSEALASWKSQSYYELCLFIALLIGSFYMSFRFLKKEEELESQRLLTTHASRLSTLGEMSAAIAHEIKNPLGVICMRSKMIHKKVAKQDVAKEDIEKYVDLMISMSNRIEKIITGMRNISRSGENEELKSVNLSQILTDTLDLCSQRLLSRGVKLEIDTVPSIKIPCREIEISQVFLNLINNASDAIEKCEERWIHIKFQLQKEYILISFVDSGKGIPKDIANKMMDSFFSTKEIGKGTGLGLSISRKIIEAHKGKFEYNSNDPNTRFDITLPLG